jgi:hypothetical protein
VSRDRDQLLANTVDHGRIEAQRDARGGLALDFELAGVVAQLPGG